VDISPRNPRRVRSSIKLPPVYSQATLNASLNAISAVLLVAGFSFILRGNIRAHRACMLSAFGASTVFLISYVVYHIRVGNIRFLGQGWIRPVYFTLLISHVFLAIVILPLAIITLTRALREQFDRHRRIARWTLPLWLYVSVTGVIVYVMLYHLYPHS
jgi:putative membrane protein